MTTLYPYVYLKVQDVAAKHGVKLEPVTGKVGSRSTNGGGIDER